MDANAIKNKVLQEIKDLMDQKMVDGLKSKSPKFAKVDIQSDDPKLANELKDKLMTDSEDMSEDPTKEAGLPDLKEDLNEGENPMNEDPDMDKLLELYKSLK